ncbi:MAG: energy transducer TonB, partial [Deltaproteobacteria bacterium]|nr:energy transducer TonB [Deltaproteobacteria bacterium]
TPAVPGRAASPAPAGTGEGRPGAGSAGQGQGVRGEGRGSGGDPAGSARGYQDANYNYIKNRIKRYLVYNPMARRMGIEGTATVAFTILAGGEASGAAIVKSSGHEGLDQSALAAVRNASPFPPPPAPARVVIPVVFSLR